MISTHLLSGQRAVVLTEDGRYVTLDPLDAKVVSSSYVPGAVSISAASTQPIESFHRPWSNGAPIFPRILLSVFLNDNLDTVVVSPVVVFLCNGVE